MTGPVQGRPQDTVVPNDPFGIIKKEKGLPGADPRTVEAFHARDDIDSSVNAHHHTLGVKHNQAAPGDHVHDGSGSRKLGYNQGLAISGAKGGNAALASVIALLKNVIDFTDNTTA